MGKPSSLCFQLSKYHFSTSFGGSFSFLPLSLAITTFILIFIYIFMTSNVTPNQQDKFYREPSPISSLIQKIPLSLENAAEDFFLNSSRTTGLAKGTLGSIGSLLGLYGNCQNGTDVYHDGDLFQEEYKQMNRSFKIFVYPHSRDDPFSTVLLPVDDDARSIYASELHFMKVLAKSHFITRDPAKAHLFFMPFSIVKMRHDPRIGPGGMQDFIKEYILNISHKYPYWYRAGGADHFYVACHPTWRVAMDKAVAAKLNAIQVVCSSSYFTPEYIPHKDVSMPQIKPRHGDPSILVPLKRKQLAFFSGAINSLVRVALLKVWANDSDIVTHFGQLMTPEAHHLLSSKFCLHVKGFEADTAQLADAIHYGCVPVIISNHYDLPFADILNWRSFAVMIHHIDIPVLKKIVQAISLDLYTQMQSNVLNVRKHFQWNASPVDYDAFYMTMYELWLRRSSVKVQQSRSL